MRRKKVLVHGSLDTLKEFISDASSREFEIVAVLSNEPEKISVNVDVFKPQAVPKCLLKLVDGIIFTDSKSDVDFFLKQGIAPRKIILWNSQHGWEVFGGRDNNGVQIIFVCGLEFHIRNRDDAIFLNRFMGILQRQRQIKNLNPQQYPAVVAQQFQQRTGRPLNFNNPQTFTEKIQWLKIFDATPLKSRLADKYLVRSWVAEKIGDEYLIPLLGVWDDAADIDFDALPNQFVLKCNHGCSMNIICRDKNNFDRRNAREKLNAWLADDYSINALEPHYTRINRKIIAEKFMADGDAPDLTDYKFGCFNGNVLYCKATTERSTFIRCTYFDMNWQPMDFSRDDHPKSDYPEKIRRPKNFELMKKLAATLAQDFAFVRVDFYEINGKVYFGEMTFTPGAGNFSYKSEGTDEYLGTLMKLPNTITPPHDTLDLSFGVRQKFQHSIEFPSPHEQIPDRKVIASLTSWTKRISTAHLAIQTILNQTRRPDLTVLYLADEEFPRHEKDLPPELLALCSERFEIRWTKNIRSYKKLIPALKDFSDEIIITFDDDLFYRREVVERLLAAYEKNPELIQCHRATTVHLIDGVQFSRIYYDKPTFLHKLTGVGGVLYPPHSLREEIFDEKTFMRLAPTGDDVWFWAQSLLNGRRVNVVENNLDKLNYIPNTQEVALWLENDGDKKLTISYVDNVLNAYPVLREILLYEQRLADG